MLYATTKLWVSASKDVWKYAEQGGLALLEEGHIVNFDEWDGYAHVADVEMTMTMRSRADVLPETIAGLRRAAEVIRLDAATKSHAIDLQIANLLAIEAPR